MIDLVSLKQSKTARRVLAGPIALRRQWSKVQERAANQVLDRVALACREDLVVAVPEHFGEFALSPKSHLARRILRHGVFEPEIAELYYKRIVPDRDVIDVGANVGFFTVGGAKHLKTGRVLAVEPTPGAFARLLRNVNHNDVANKVILHNGLLSSAPGEHEFHSIEGMEEYSSMGRLTHPSTTGTDSRSVKVQAVRLDDLVEMHGLRPALIKVDVEGAEHLVFSGAVETLKKHRPCVISELSDPLLRNLGGTAEEVVSFFEGLGYRVTDPANPKARPGQRSFGDILCVPVEAG
ncbi:MAG: FkbM family methyltransferase [Alphaproteobacteria bacterium]|nr:FkbM family methyltransferase [Alphaproteobacteria bacterium]MBU1525487.1 FkbM family methyltransferase [Alphaproteobacteria bacterium]MBU2350889.1 FkbM family methyltransferase [Alphaproteobacteria bacterium]MBU2381730.1 FkbM family methyltransferase [Alphaproteobacteria bacterium]